MVTAGVYLIARSMPLLTLAPGVLTLIAATGCATALLSAAIAVTQTDLKRVLAYSTVSQLGYMFMALGSGVGNVAQLAIVAGMFHLFTHAFFKALLFLAAGSVMHAMGDVIDMRRFRGLRHRLPHTYLTFAVGAPRPVGDLPALRLLQQGRDPAGDQAGRARRGLDLPPDLLGRGLHGLPDGVLHGPGLLHDVLGDREAPQPRRSRGAADRRADDAHAHAGGHGDDHGHADTDAHGHGSHVGHESPPIMTYPLFALAGCTILIGLVCLLAGPFWGTTEWFAHHLHATLGFESLKHEEHHFDWLTAIDRHRGRGGRSRLELSRCTPSPARCPAGWPSGFAPCTRHRLHKFRVDEIYGWLVVRPTRALAVVCDFLDTYLVDRLVTGVAKLPRLFGRDVLARYQNGLIQNYAAVSALSVAILLFILVLLTQLFHIGVN